MSSAEIIKRLIADGWVKKRQTGSPITLIKPGITQIITIPHPRKDASKGIIRQAQEISGCYNKGAAKAALFARFINF